MIIIYLIGVLLSYLCGRWYFKKEDVWDWAEIFVVAIISIICSFFGLVIFIILLFIDFITDTNLPKPPKWL